MQSNWSQNRQQNVQPQQGAQFLDFNKIAELPSKYPRQELPENCEENM